MEPYPLSRDQSIYLIIFKKFKIPEICSKINTKRMYIEKKEIYDYHYERWETIASKYFNAIENMNRYISKIYFTKNNVKYISRPDYIKEYHKETKISQQVRDMILELICIQDKNKRKKEDKLYSLLSKLIMEKMND